MTSKEWLTLANEHMNEIEEACLQAYRASIFSNTYHTVQLDEFGRVTVDEYLDSRSVSMDVWEGRAIVLAKYPPYDPTENIDLHDEEDLIESYLSEEDMAAFRAWCAEQEADVCLSTLQDYSWAAYLDVIGELSDDCAKNDPRELVFEPLDATLEELRRGAELEPAE